MGLEKKSTFGNDTSKAFTYDHQNKYLMNFGYFWSSLHYDSSLLRIIYNKTHNTCTCTHVVNNVIKLFTMILQKSDYVQLGNCFTQFEKPFNTFFLFIIFSRN